jgi:uncharacterized protein YjbJ (UPF0337 family)
LSTDGKESEMNRDRMENKWKQIKANADEQPWDELTTDDQLVNRIRETYGIADDETECQLTDWQARLK